MQSLSEGQTVGMNSELDLPAEEVYVFPASYSQQRLWFLDQLEPGSAFYNIPAAVRLQGHLNVSALSTALNEIVRRHETLRTTFHVQDGQPVQVIALDQPLNLSLVNLQSLPVEERESEIQRLAVEEARRPFDLHRGPLFRVSLLVLGVEEHVLLLTMHHIISDGWSMGVLIREIVVLYTTFSRGEPSPLPDLPIQYADFTIWQRDRLAGIGLQTQIEYWKKQLGENLPVLKLPSDRSRPPVQSFRGASFSRKIPASLLSRVKTFSRAEGATLFMTLLTAFQVLLYRYTGQDDLCVGTPYHSRTTTELEDLIGFFVNTLVVRGDLSGEPSFRALLARIKPVILDAFANQDLPFDTLVEILKPDRDLSHNPIFQVMFILQNAPVRWYSLPGLNLTNIEAETGTSTFDLTLSLSEMIDGMDASIEYNTDLFDEDTISAMLDRFELLLEGILTNPDQSISTIQILLGEERRAILEDWNNTVLVDPRSTATVQGLFASQAAKHPDTIALVWMPPESKTGEREILTYGELDQRSNRLARFLSRLETGPDVAVGICMERSLEMVVAVLGVLKAGCAYLPIDPTYPSERLAYMLADSGVSILLTQERLVANLPEHSARTICIDAQWPSIELESAEPLENRTSPENLAYLIYTSGSTGRPKGVLVHQRNLVNAYLAWEKAYDLGEIRSHLQMANFAFDVFSGDLVRALCSGGKLVLCPREYLLSPQDLYGLMVHELVECAEFVPVVLRGLIHYLQASRQDLAFMRRLICGSDIWYVEEFNQIRSLCGPQTRVINSFGVTEATIDSSYFEGSELPFPPDAVVPIGRPYPNQRLYILDKHLQPVPPLVHGELFVGGLSVAKGYLNQPELTAQKFIPDPFDTTPGSRLYRTGDLARYLKDGQIEFLGRLDEQVKIRGFRVEIGEIESVLRQHPAVHDAVVVARDVNPEKKSVTRGKNQCLVAYLVADISMDRIPLQARCQVSAMLPDSMVEAESQPVDLMAIDLSEKGACLVDVPVEWSAGQSLIVKISFPDQEQEMSLEGRIVWRQGMDAGVVFYSEPGKAVGLRPVLRKAREIQLKEAEHAVTDLRRGRIRIPVKAGCRIEWDGGESFEAQVENLSTGGLRLSGSGLPWQKGQSLQLSIHLPEELPELNVAGTVWWVRGSTIGIRFDPRAGEQAKIDQAVEALLQMQGFSLAHLRSFLKAHLPDYMFPAAYVILDKLPLTPNGKVNRQALPEPEISRQEWEETYVAPSTPTEETLLGIWSQILDLEPARISMQDNFFDLGGHSLLATQVISRVRDVFQVDLPLRRIFESPTIASFAAEIDEARRTQAGVQGGSIQPVSRDQDLPLSFAQQRLWFLDQLEPNSPFYNIPESVHLTGKLDIGIFERALNEVVRRHEILRTTFETIDGKPIQRIAAESKMRVKVIDLEGLPADARDREVIRLAQIEAQQPFNLAVWPLMRVLLLRLSAEDHVILITMHHIIGDDWSTNVLVQEITQLYAAFSAGKASPLPGLPIQYADYAVWQKGWMQGEVLERQLSFWKEMLAGLPPLLELPTDRPRPAVQSFRGAYQTFGLSSELSARIRALCQQENATLFMLILAAFQVLLARYSGQEDISVGTPIANRNRADIEPLIGFFVNTLVLRTDLSGDPSFRDLLKRVREIAFSAYAHQDMPFEKIVDALQPERNLSYTPLFQVMLVFQNTPQRIQEFPGMSVSPLEVHSGTAKFDLTLFMLEEGEQIGGALEYNTDLFDDSTITRLINHFQVLLEGIVQNPDQTLGHLPLLTLAESQQIIEGWNDTQAEFPSHLCAHQLIEEQISRTPDAVAVTFQGSSLTYAGLNRQANQLAQFLRKRGVGPEVCVGICMERSLELMVGFLGIWKAGGAYIPIDPHYPPDRLAFMLEDSRVPVLLTQERLLAGLPEMGVEVICLDRDWDVIAQESDVPAESGVGPDNLAYVIYTSGSTGKPKGAMIIHRGLVNYLTWCQRAYPLVEGRGTPVHSSISFDLTVTSLFPALLAGKTVFMLPEDQGVEALSEFLSREKDLSLIKITPAHLKLIGEQVNPREAARLTHSFIIGGENLLVDHIAAWQENAPATDLVNEYGPTETVVGCCVYTAPRGKHKTGVIPIGKPIINTRLYVLDRFLQPVPVGVRGELYIAGAGVARGYLNRPELTAERFLPDPFSVNPEDRMYKTGDVVRYLPDGNIECLGRVDFQIKLRGFRIELGEIEALLGQFTGIKEAAAWVLEENERKRLVAYLVPDDLNTTPNLDRLRGFLQTRLPDYMIPSAFVVLDHLPLTPNGKLDRKALPHPVDPASQEGGSERVAPRTQAEQILAAIWREMLGLQEVSVEDNFFELGGDSIVSIQIVSRARQAGLNLSPRMIFEFPTIAGLAQAGSSKLVQAEQGLVDGEVDLTPIQTWFTNLNLSRPNHWNQSLLLKFNEEPNPSQTEQIVLALLAHHDALRLRFFLGSDGAWNAEHAPLPEKAPVIWQDLSTLADTDREAALGQVAEELQSSLNLERGEVIRFGVCWLGEERGGRLLITAHHLVMDGVSWRILLEDLGAIFSQMSQNLPVVLPPKTTSFREWSQALAVYARSQAVLDETAYWLNPAVHKMARIRLDHPGGSNTEADARSITVGLNWNETHELLHSAPAAYHCEVQTLLVAALVHALRAWSRKSAWQIELEGHGREEIDRPVDLSRTIGWFTTQYPLRVW